MARDTPCGRRGVELGDGRHPITSSRVGQSVGGAVFRDVTDASARVDAAVRDRAEDADVGSDRRPALRDYRDLTDVALRRVLEPDGRPLHRRVGEGHRARAGRGAPAAFGARAGEVAAGCRGARCRTTPTRRSTSSRPRWPRRSRATRCTAARWRRCTARRSPSVAEVVAGARLVVVLEDIVDHTNVGAIFRAPRVSAPMPCW